MRKAMLAGAVVATAAGMWFLPAMAVAAESVERTLVVDGLERTYRVYVPKDVTDLVPVVFVFHGGRGVSAQLERYTRFSELAETEKFIAAYPQGIDRGWNDGRNAESIPAQRKNIEDVKFVRTVLDDIAKSHTVDRSRVFATGISNGGIFCHRLAADASDMFAAIAPVVGGIAEPLAKDFKPKHPVSLLVIQGEADPLVPINGGIVGAALLMNRGSVIATKETVEKYLKLNGVTGEPTTSTLDDVSKDDGTTTQVTKYPSGPQGFRVEVYLIKNGGHYWPGRPAVFGERLAGKAPQDFDATRVIWQFFKTCPPRK